MRLDHLLSKEEKVKVVLLLCYQKITTFNLIESLRLRSNFQWLSRSERRFSGGDALRGNTRPHLEHDG